MELRLLLFFYTALNDVINERRKKMMFVNLTPHAINLVFEGGEKIVQPEPISARVSTIEVEDGIIDSIPAFKLSYGAVQDLPDPIEGTVFIVSKMVRDACPDRLDLYYPTRLVRDETGRIVGCSGLAH